MPSGSRIISNSLAAGLRRLASKYPTVVANGLMAEVEIETTEARRRTPVDTGTLVGTVHAEGPRYEGRSIYGMIVAGGPSAEYALIVHEDLHAHHPVGQAKYIESVIMESRQWMASRVAARIQLSEGLK